LLSSEGAFSLVSSPTGRIRRGEPAASPQEFDGLRAQALKAPFNPRLRFQLSSNSCLFVLASRKDCEGWFIGG